MNRTILACLALLSAQLAAAAPPSREPGAGTNAAIEQRVVDASVNAQQRELEIHQQVLEQQDPAVQAEFAVMMEELNRTTEKPAPAPLVEAPKPAR